MQKQNKISIFLIILSAILFFLIAIFNAAAFNIPLFGGINSDVRINFNTDDNLKVFVNGYEIKEAPNFSFNSYKTFEINNFPVYKISFFLEITLKILFYLWGINFFILMKLKLKILKKMKREILNFQKMLNI